MVSCGAHTRRDIVTRWETDNTAARIGLCASCRNIRVTPSARGTTYYLCALSANDATYPKYPHLPVLRCTGYDETSRGPDH